jgi:hypothetical protein
MHAIVSVMYLVYAFISGVMELVVNRSSSGELS